METIYDRHGGFAGIHRVVMEFYERLLDNDRLGPFFEDVDMARLIDHQTQLIASILGGPASISEARLTAAHAGHDIGNEDFDEMARVLAGTLTDHGFTPEELATVMEAVEARRGQVVA